MTERTAAGVGLHRRIVFAAGDFIVGGLTGAATAAAVRLVVAPDLDMVLAMLAGTGAGMIAHVAVGAAAAPLLGLFHVMVPAGLIGMYGGMLFAMRDVMQHPPGSLGGAVLVGAAFGVIVTGAVRLYDHVLRDPVAAGEEG